MGLNVSVVVATFGDPSWIDLANERAIPSVPEGVPFHHHHGATLAEARNEALSRVTTEFVAHLDADDELEPHYFEAMAAGSADLRAPAVSYVRGDWPAVPRVPKVVGHTHECVGECLREGNFIAIGAAVRADLIREVGGWREWPMWEDWDLFLRCYLAGATVESIAEAVYRAHVRPGSRNEHTDQAFKDKLHREILEANLPPVAA